MVSPAAERMADKINDALVAFTGCVGGGIDVCSYSLTFGEFYVPFDPDPEDADGCEDDDCSQAWVRVTDLNVLYVNEKGFDIGASELCNENFRLGLEVGVLRCFEIEGEGEAPSATDVMAYAMQQTVDMAALYTAAMGCEVWDSITVGQWSPEGPLGGQYGGSWSFTVEL